VLAEFPDIGRKVLDVGTANRELLQRQRTLAQRAQRVEDSLLSRELRAISQDYRTPEETIARAMESPRKMAQIAARVRGNPEAKSALQRAVWNEAVDTGPGELATFIEKNATALKAAGITPSHLKALRTIDAARVIASRAQFPRGSSDIPTSADAFVRTFGIRPDMLANRLREIHTGRSEPAYVIMNVLTNIFARKQGQFMEGAFRRVLYDRQVAEDLMQAILAGKMTQATTNQLQARFFAAGLTLLGDDREGSQ
jgi:hypothetical protein